MGWASSVGIATRYGLDGPGIEDWWRVRISAPVQTFSGAHLASYTMCTGSFLGVKRPGRGVDYPPPSSAEIKERVELHLYSTPCAFVGCFRVNFELLRSKPINFFFVFYRNYRSADKSLARPGRKQARKHVKDARDFGKIETQAVIKFYARQGAEGNSRHSDRNISLFPSWSG